MSLKIQENLHIFARIEIFMKACILFYEDRVFSCILTKFGTLWNIFFFYFHLGSVVYLIILSAKYFLYVYELIQ